MTVRFTAVDLETGDTSTVDVEPGSYCIVAVEPCHVAHQQHHANGTTVLTVKGRTTPVPVGSTEVPQTRGVETGPGRG